MAKIRNRRDVAVTKKRARPVKVKKVKTGKRSQGSGDLSLTSGTVSHFEAIDLVQARTGIRDRKFAQFELLKRLRDGRLRSEEWCFDPRTGDQSFFCWLPQFWEEYILSSTGKMKTPNRRAYRRS
jgi:hypothetical protein